MNYDRRSEIIKILDRQPTIKNEEIMERFHVSIETVRRDLAYLEERGLLERVYGGAVRKSFMSVEPEYKKREKTHLSEKTSIAIEAEKLIYPNDIVFFDVGTTVAAIAKNVDASKRISAFTNSLRTAITLSEKGCDVILPGGKLRSGEFSVSGWITENSMKQFNFDKAFIGVGGITENGITDFVAEEAGLRAQIIQNARVVIAVADHSKFGVRAMCNICPANAIHVLITDAKAPADVLKGFEKNGTKVLVV